MNSFHDENLQPQEEFGWTQIRIPLVLGLISFLFWMIVFIFPPTSWIVKSELREQFPNRSRIDYFSSNSGSNQENAPSVAKQKRYIRQAADKRPNDLEVQIAAALEKPIVSGKMPITPKESMDELLALTKQFPNRPELLSVSCRTLMIDRFKIVRPDVPPEAYARTTHLPEMEKDRLLRIAATEKLEELCSNWVAAEPNNGAAHLFLATALIGLTRDEEAFAELHRAAYSPDFDEHLDTELNGRIRLHELMDGRSSSLQKYLDAQLSLFPHYSSWRIAVQICIYLAGQKEKRGQLAEGLQIRKEILSTASMVRGMNNSIFGSLVGSSIGTVVSSYLKGENPTKPKNVNFLAVQVGVNNAYVKFLQDHGNSSEAIRFRREINAGNSVRTIDQKYLGGNWAGPIDSKRLLVFWMVGALLLSNLIWTAIFLVFTTVILWRRSARIRMNQRADDPFTYGMILCLTGLLGSALYTGQSNAIFSNIAKGFWYFSANGSPFNNAEQIWKMVAFTICMIGPLLVFILSLIWATVKRRRFAATLFGGMLRALAGLSISLVLLYVVTLYQIAKVEQVEDAKLTTYLKSETQFAAKKVNLPWPPRILPD